MKDLKTKIEKQDFNFEKLCERFDVYIKDPKFSNLTQEELEEYSKLLDIMMERKAKDIALRIVFDGRSTKKQKQAIRALAKNEGIRVKRTKKRRFNRKRELVTSEEKEAFKKILYTEGIDVSDDTFEQLFE